MEPGECLVSATLPVWNEPRVGVGFFEIANRRRDLAIVAAAAQVAIDDEGRCIACAAGLGGLADRPWRLDGLDAALVGSTLAHDDVRVAVEKAVATVPAVDKPHATAGFRARAAVKLMMNAICAARAEASGKTDGVAG